jgi:phage regulator Rha-like protein
MNKTTFNKSPFFYDKYNNLRSQFVTLKENLNEDMRGKHRKYLPYVFTEQGVSMLSAILKTDFAIEISIKIIETFVAMRKYLASKEVVFFF